MKTKEQTIEEYTRLLSPCELATLLIEAQTTSNQAIDLLTTALINDQAKEKTIKEQADRIKYQELEIKCKQKTIDELTPRPGRKESPAMTDPAQEPIKKALENIIDNITDAVNDTQDNINYSYALPLDTDELTEALITAREALKTAYNIAEELKQARHLDQR